jgi:hypothetical protein
MNQQRDRAKRKNQVDTVFQELYRTLEETTTTTTTTGEQGEDKKNSECAKDNSGGET